MEEKSHAGVEISQDDQKVVSPTRVSSEALRSHSVTPVRSTRTLFRTLPTMLWSSPMLTSQDGDKEDYHRLASSPHS
jgi:hypothetical protein